MNSVNSIENDNIKFWIEDGILYSEQKRPITLTIEVVKEGIDLRHQLSNNQKQYWCFAFEKLNTFTTDAANYGDNHGQDLLHAIAVIVKNPVAMFLFNTYNKWHAPKIPFRAFKTKAEAVNWLKELKQKNEK